MTAAERPDVLTAAEPFVQQCGPCDFGVTTAGCVCPSGDFRPVMFRLMEEVRRLRAELASREPQILAEEPGPDITEVYDRDGHPWERNKAGLWCAFGVDSGVPTSWGSLARVWGPISTERQAAGR